MLTSDRNAESLPETMPTLLASVLRGEAVDRDRVSGTEAEASFVATAAATAALRPSTKSWSFSISRSATVPEFRLLSSSLVSSSSLAC